MTYKALIFDVGKVLIDITYDNVFQSWAASSGKSAEKLKSRFEFDDFFDRFERGEITAQYFRAKTMERLKILITDEAFDKGWCSVFTHVQPGIEILLMALKQNYRLVALTNTNVLHNETCLSKFADVLQHFEKLFCSCEMLTIKPEDKSYNTVLDYLKCKPSEIVFIDDKKENIKKAKKLGLKTITATSPQQLKEQLEELKIMQFPGQT